MNEWSGMKIGADSWRADMDKIFIRDLSVRCIVGACDWERNEKQDVIINIVLETDLSKPAETDRLEDAVDYRAIKKRVIALAENSSFQLIESLAENIAAICLDDPAVERVQVTVDKPGALRFARSVAVEIVRERGN